MAPEDTRELRIVILSYNTCELLSDCLASLQADPQAHRWHVVVVDNASSDDSPRMVQERFPWVTLVQSDDNRGFSAGNNLGMVDAAEEYALFLNSDTVVPAGAVGRLLEFVKSHDDCSAAGPRLENPDGSPQPSCRTFPGPLNTLIEGFWLDRLLPRSRLLGRPRMTWLTHHETVPVDYVAGAALMVRREEFEQVGGWPQAYFFYAEDAELCRALAAGGRKVYFTGDIAITHIGGASAGLQSLWTTIQAHRSVLLFSLRNGGPGRLLLHRIALTLTTLPRLLGALLLWPLAGLQGKGSGTRQRIAVYAGALRPVFTPARKLVSGP